MSELSLTQPEPQAPALLAPAVLVPAVLVLADGIVLRGLAFGALGTALVLWAAGRVASPAAGLPLALAALEEGAGWAKLEQLRTALAIAPADLASAPADLASAPAGWASAPAG